MSNNRQLKGLKQLLALAKDPLFQSMRYRWLSVLFSGLGFALIFQTLIALSRNYHPVSHLVYSGIAGGLLIGLGFYCSSVYIGRKYLSPFLDKKEIERKINETNT